MAKTQFNYTGANQIFTVPAGVYYLTVKVWGAGGGYSGYGTSGSGCGGYSTGTMFVTPGQTFDVMVGGKGIAASTIATYGGGGAGGVGSGAGAGPSGGGRSGVAFTGQSQFIIAGGGGGNADNIATTTTFGGNGGGLVGTDVILTAGAFLVPVTVPTGGTQTAGGTGGQTTPTSINGTNGTALQGGKGGPDNVGTNGGGGGGGGGYFGGGGGNAGNLTNRPDETPGAGGSAFIDNTVLITSSTQSIPTATSKQAVLLPPNSTDPDYVTGIGVGGSGSGNGLVVFDYTPLTLTKTVDKLTSSVGDTLTYTIVFNGDGLVYNNAFFYDTIPSNTTFVTDSVYVNGTQQTGANPNPPGISVGSIGPSSTTITFNVQVTSFPLSPYTIPNSANIFATSVPTVTSNIVNTTILGASLIGTKVVNKTTASIGDILTYTIPITNSGNTTASNILFIDTIPNGTTLIAGSLKQGTTAISGSPNPPGITLPSPVKGGAITTVTFQVRVTAIPNPNPIPNTASLAYSYLVGTTTITNASNTNTVNTSVNFASLSGITKYVDKSYANCGDTITYTIVAPNSGTVSAQNVVFKDTIPNGTVFVPSSVYVNGTLQNGANPASGVTIPNIGPGATATLTFQVQVQC